MVYPESFVGYLPRHYRQEVIALEPDSPSLRDARIYCLPIVTGAGTKNRTLTAIANGLEVITIPMGIENIMYKELEGVYIALRVRQFAKKMWHVCQAGASHHVSASWIEERMAFRTRTIRAYEESITEILRDEAER